MKLKWRTYFRILIDSGYAFVNDNGTKLSASLAYYTIFSIGPLLLVVFSFIGFFYKSTTLTPEVFDYVSQLIGRPGANELQSIMTSLSLHPGNTLFGVIGVLVLLFGATGIFTEIQSSINYIWSIKTKPKHSWLKYILDRLLSFSLIIGSGFLLMVTLLLNVLMDLLAARLQHLFGDANVFLWKGVNIALLYLVVVFLFAIIYKVLPDAHIHWRDSVVGACFTGVLFLIGKFLISYYLGASKIVSIYGAAASLILLLSWVYYSAMILYFGAEFTKVYSIYLGGGITVYDTAVHIVKHETKVMPDKELRLEDDEVI